MMQDDYEILSLTFFKTWHELAQKYKLNKAEYGELVHAMAEYCFYGEKTELAPPAGIILDMALTSIDASNRKKLEGHIGGVNARGKSGAPFGNQNARNLGNQLTPLDTRSMREVLASEPF